MSHYTDEQSARRKRQLARELKRIERETRRKAILERRPFLGLQVRPTASVEDDTPRWLRNTGKGWVTAEYSMLPGSSPERIRRRVSGRDQEIQRLIGRSLRAVIDLEALGERSIMIDCDVLQADGGTRTAAITGAWVALHLAFGKLIERGEIDSSPLYSQVGAISCGIFDGQTVLDLDYAEDSNCQADANFVLTDEGGIIEIQGTAETKPFGEDRFHELFALAKQGVTELGALQRKALGIG